MMLGIRRREFVSLLGCTAACPITAQGQQAAVPVIGFLLSGSPREDAGVASAFRQGLGDAGFIEGRTVAIEYRWAENQYDRLPDLAADLIHRNVAVLFVGGATIGPRAAKAATSKIPIVFSIGGDPVRLGLVASLGRPEANVTGVTNFGHATVTKRFDLLRELMPKAAAVALLVNPNNPNTTSDISDAQMAAQILGLRLVVVYAGNEADFDIAFATLVGEKADALAVANDAFFTSSRDRIVLLAAKHAVPAIYGTRQYAEAGGLMSYGSSQSDSFREAGVYVGRILKGAKPADLPVLLPTKFEFLLNLKTAKAFGLDVPFKLHAFADEVIE